MAAQRLATVSKLIKRVEEHLSTTLGSTDCVAVCVASSFPRDREELLEFLLSPVLSKAALVHADELALKEDEWSALFGKDSALVRESSVLAVTNDIDFKKHTDALSDALRCSLTESASRAAWQRPSCRLSCYIALYTDSSEEWMAHVLGGLVKADTRRLDDVRCSIEDNETDHMLLSRSVIALASCVT